MLITMEDRLQLYCGFAELGGSMAVLTWISVVTCHTATGQRRIVHYDASVQKNTNSRDFM